MSNYIIDHAEEIAEWQIEGPHGSFYPAENVIKERLSKLLLKKLLKTLLAEINAFQYRDNIITH